MPSSTGQAQLSVAVVAHVARQHAAHHLARQLGGRLFLDNGELGEVANHRRAWQWATTQPAGWTLIIQDDAIPIPGMLDQLSAGLATLPRPGLVSLYLGTSYPTQHQRAIARAVQRADKLGAAWIESDQLLHGVAVAAPNQHAPQIADRLNDPAEPYDETLSDWNQRHGPGTVFYTWPSLADHADGPTLLEHPDGRGREKPRHAWRTGAPQWNQASIKL